MFETAKIYIYFKLTILFPFFYPFFDTKNFIFHPYNIHIYTPTIKKLTAYISDEYTLLDLQGIHILALMISFCIAIIPNFAIELVCQSTSRH